MNAEPLAEVRAAINAGDVNRARELLRPYLINEPDAEAYYLAYRVAVNDYQRRKFLNQSLEIDPFNEDAERALMALEAGEPLPDELPKQKRSYGTASSIPAHTEQEVKRGIDIADAPDDTSAQRYELAGFGQRFAAYFLDGIIYVIVLITLTIFLFNPFDPEIVAAMNSSDFSSIQQENRLLNLLFIGFNLTYNLYFLTRSDGQTPGKMALGIKIIKRNGEPLSLLDAFLRNVVGYWLSTFFLFIGFLWMLFDPQHQTWHDKIANTVVVKKPGP